MLLEEIAFELGLEGWAAMFKRRKQGKGIPAPRHKRKWPKSRVSKGEEGVRRLGREAGAKAGKAVGCYPPGRGRVEKEGSVRP